MLSLLSGREHHVLTGVALVHAGRLDTAQSAPPWCFRPITDRGDVSATGIPASRATRPAATQSGTRAAFVERIEGSYSASSVCPFETRACCRIRV